MGVIWTVMPCYNLLKGTDDPTAQYQLLAFAGVAFVLMIVFHYLWRRVRNRTAYEIQNYRAQVRRNKMKNL
jgi:membrane protein implicated in regulation of membrane protease activity